MKLACVAILSSIVFISILVNLYPYLGFDAASFYYGGLVISKGGVPYVDFIDNKGPAIFYLLSIPAKFFEWDTFPSLILFRIIDLTILVLVAVLLHCFVKSFWIEIVSLFCFWITYLNTFASTFETIYCEMPEVLCLLIAYLLAFRARFYFVIGLLIGAATLFRQPAITHSLAIFVFILSSERQRYKINLNLINSLFKISLGITTLIGGVVIAAWQGGWLSSWWLSTLIWPLRYMEAFPPFWTRIPTVILYLFENDFLVPFGIGLILWSFLLLVDLIKKSEEAIRYHLLLLIMFFIGVIEVSLTGRIWRHQLIPLLPALVCIYGYAISRFVSLLYQSRQRSYQFLLLLISVIITFRPTFGIASEMFGRLSFFQEREVTYSIGNWLASRTKPDENVLVWGFAPQIYLESRRFAGVGQFHNLLITNLNGAFEMNQNDLLNQFENDLKLKKPKYIVNLSGTDLLKLFPWIKERYIDGKIITRFGGYKYLGRKE